MIDKIKELELHIDKLEIEKLEALKTYTIYVSRLKVLYTLLIELERANEGQESQ